MLSVVLVSEDWNCNMIPIKGIRSCVRVLIPVGFVLYRSLPVMHRYSISV